MEPIAQIADMQTLTSPAYPAEAKSFQTHPGETLGHAPHKHTKGATLLWGISGGTVLSVAGFVALTMYQQYTDSFNELRNDLKHLNQTTSEHAKREEVSNRMSKLWTAMKDTNKEVQSARESFAAQGNRLDLLEQQLKSSQEDRRELLHEVQRLRERLARFEGRQIPAATPPGRQDAKNADNP
jgi:hypothetical protein